MAIGSARRGWQELLGTDPASLGIAADDCATVVLVDTDRLKAVNDGLGYGAGDALLDRFHSRLSAWSGPQALVVDVGRGTFGVIRGGLPDDARAAAAVAQLPGLLSAPVELDGLRVSRHVSVGYATGRLAELPLATLVRQADDAFERATWLPGDVVVGYRPEMSEAAAAAAQIELYLQEAVEHRQLLLHYQPELDLRTGQVLAVEALLRWWHPTRGLLGAGEFIDVAQRTGLTGELGAWALREACTQRAEWLHTYPRLRFPVRVNVSPTELVVRELPELVADVLDEAGLPPALLCLEMTELVPASDPDAAVSNLNQLRALGVLVALDDFGAGHSSLRRLKAMPLDVLKIDQEFVLQLPHNAVDPVIVGMLVSMARTWNLDLVAEGVESRETAAALLRLGCWRAQGRYLAEPAPPDALADLLAAGGISRDRLPPDPEAP
jgi:diguanylate cyclase (GGDEF)-like protein